MTRPEESRRLHAVQSPIIPVVAGLIRAHPGTISLGQGVVGYGPPPAAAEAIGRCLADPVNHKYQAVGGSPVLLEAITAQLAQEHGIAVGGESRLMATAGSNNAFIAALLAIADPGDEVILPTPYYFNHEMAITMANCRPVLVPTNARHQLDLDALRAAIGPRTRAIVTISPNNPTGAVYPPETLRAVNALCAERGIFHISDEAYSYFTYEGAAHFSAGSIPGAAEHTISLFSMSKAYGFASWRIGWMVFPARLEAALLKVQDTLIICPPVVSQYAAAGALSVGGAWVRERVEAIAGVRKVVQGLLAPLATEGLCEIPPAQGAFYFLLRMRDSAAQLASAPPDAALRLTERLIREHRVAVVPGNAFGLLHARTLRVAYGALSCETAAEGIGRLVDGLRAIRRAEAQG